ncbi:DNA replication/repair protein RecF [Candidatus Microgenomates bacterium]|nr:DNA replication/repair protein RecF [Candidatus Microgenomates bacterium]
MILKTLTLAGFRSYKNSHFDFSPEINLIIGPNTAGKTNLLEAIYLLSSAKSFRAQKEKEMVNWFCETAHLTGKTEEAILAITLTRGELGGEKVIGKRLLLNNIGRRRLDFVGNLKAVVFSPEDLELIGGSPSSRRGYLDAVLEQIDKEYRRASLTYTKALRTRNKLLVKRKEGERVLPEEMAYWDDLLLENGPVLAQKREEFIDFLNNHGDSGRKIVYDKSLMSSARLVQYAEEEVAAGMTLVGPQRDDFSFEFENRNLAIYGSRGEQRLAVLWLKLGELEFMVSKCGERPILLLDDIFSELDHKHRRYVFDIIPQQQTIITATDLHLIEQDYQQKAKMIELRLR